MGELNMRGHLLQIDWDGLNPAGDKRGARGSYTLAEIARITKTYYEGGWIQLSVRSGDGPLGQHNQVEIARITTDAATGERTWWVVGTPTHAFLRSGGSSRCAQCNKPEAAHPDLLAGDGDA